MVPNGIWEDVMEHEDDPLSCAQPLEHHQQGQPDLVVEGDAVVVAPALANSVASAAQRTTYTTFFCVASVWPPPAC